MQHNRFKDIPRFISQRGGYGTDVPIAHILTKLYEWVNEGLILEPDFQRGHVWTKPQQIAYVEFLLRGGRSGRDLYFNKPGWLQPVPPGEYDEFVCVDGLQRITAISRFLRSEIPAFGTLYKDYQDKLPVTQTVRFNVHSLPKKSDVLTWYLEMNEGGTPHTKTELTRVKTILRETLEQNG